MTKRRKKYKDKDKDSDGPVIEYKWKGIKVMRTKGYTGRQAPIAKVQASILGKASSLSARIRKACKPILPGRTDRVLMYRLNNILQQWLRTGQTAATLPVDNISLITGFSFYGITIGESFPVAMPVSRTSDGKLLIHIQ